MEDRRVSLPNIVLGDTWSNGDKSVWVDLFGAGMIYDSELREILISRVTIDFTFEVFCFEYTLEWLHHYFNETMGEDVCHGFEIAEDFMADHFFGPEYSEPFGFYVEGKEMITFEGVGEDVTTIIEMAANFAKAYHKDQLDDAGEDYFHSHLVGVARILTQVTDDPILISAGYLHDIIEDTEMTYSDLAELFGTKIADLVHEVTREGSKDRKGYYFPRLRTERGYLLKFADRLSNLSRMNPWAPGRRHSYLRKSRFWKSTEDEKPHPEIVPIILLEDMEETEK